MTATDKADIDRALADAIFELIRHGGTKADIEVLRKQFKALAADEEAKLTDKLIPE